MGSAINFFYCHLLLFSAYSLTIFAEGQLAHLTGSDKLVPTSSVETTRHQDDEPMVFTILEANQAKPECKLFCPYYIYTHAHAYTHACTCTRTHAHAPLTHTYTHTHTHIYVVSFL